jgi:hypothetical protein
MLMAAMDITSPRAASRAGSPITAWETSAGAVYWCEQAHAPVHWVEPAGEHIAYF